jgi:hypothetical protein
MKLHNSISILITSLLLCGNAFAKPGNDEAPPTVDVNVVNTPDVFVSNIIPLDDLETITLVLDYSAPGSARGQGIPQGYLHGYSLSVAPDSGGGLCMVSLSTRTGLNSPPYGERIEKTIATAIAQETGSSIAQDFTTPIAVLFDPTTHETLVIITIDSTASTASECLVSAVVRYTEL